MAESYDLEFKKQLEQANPETREYFNGMIENIKSIKHKL